MPHSFRFLTRIESGLSFKSGKRVPDNRPLLPYIALAALILLAIEWWAFHRRVYLN